MTTLFLRGSSDRKSTEYSTPASSKELDKYFSDTQGKNIDILNTTASTDPLSANTPVDVHPDIKDEI